MAEVIGEVGMGAANRAEDVMTVQRLLTAAGYAPGAADGTAGPATLAALAAWGAEHGCPARIAPGPGLAALAAAADWSGAPGGWNAAKRLRSLEPGFRAKLVDLIAALETAGFRPTIASAWRSVEMQAELVRQKRSTVRFSFHNARTADRRPAALAADIVDARWAWRAPECMAFFRALGAAAKARGLVWGGDWKSFPDVAHVQGRPNEDLAAVRRASGCA